MKVWFKLVAGTACGALLLAAGAALAGTQSDAPKEQPPAPSLPPNETLIVFADNCMSHFFSGVDLHARFDKGDYNLPANEAAKFLGGKPGSVWRIKGRESSYSIALLGSDDICSVTAETSADSTWEDFDKLLNGLFPGVDLVPVPDEVAGGAAAGEVRSKGFRLRTNGKFLPPIFTMSDSRKENAPFQATVTLFFPSQPDGHPEK